MQYVFQNDAIFCIHISQGSVATCLKRGGIFKYEFVANLLELASEKKYEIIFSEVVAKSLVSCFFDSRCSLSAKVRFEFLKRRLSSLHARR